MLCCVKPSTTSSAHELLDTDRLVQLTSPAVPRRPQEVKDKSYHPKSPIPIRHTVSVGLGTDLAHKLHDYFLATAQEGMLVQDTVRELLQVALAAIPTDATALAVRQQAFTMVTRDVRRRIGFALAEIARDLEHAVMLEGDE